MQVERHADTFPAPAFDLRESLANRAGQRVGASINRARGDIDRRPRLGEDAGRALADAPARPGHDRNLTRKRLHQNGFPAKKATLASSLTRPV